MRAVICCFALLGMVTSASAATKASPAKRIKPAAKAVKSAKTAVKPVKTAKTLKAVKIVKAAQGSKATSGPTRAGPTETLTCRNGTEDRHARIGVVLRGGVVDSFAYYSKWKPRTCSIYLQRQGDPYSKWLDRGGVTQVKLERGQFQIERDKGAYRFVFRDIDRERYCGMDGAINGTLVVRKGSGQCEVSGIMEEGTPLGQAWVHLQQDAPTEGAPAASATTPQPVEPVAQVTERTRRPSVYTFQSGVRD